MYARLASLTEAQEFTIPAGYGEGDKIGHALYVSIRLEQKVFTLRIDNCAPEPYLSSKHPTHPQKKQHIQPHLLAWFGQAQHTKAKKQLVDYLEGLLKIALGATHLNIKEKVDYIYGCSPSVSLPQWGNQPAYTKAWPYTPLQAKGMTDCTMNSYDVGLQLRLGKSLYTWMSKESAMLLFRKKLTSKNEE